MIRGAKFHNWSLIKSQNLTDLRKCLEWIKVKAIQMLRGRNAAQTCAIIKAQICRRSIKNVIIIGAQRDHSIKAIKGLCLKIILKLSFQESSKVLFLNLTKTSTLKAKIWKHRGLDHQTLWVLKVQESTRPRRILITRGWPKLLIKPESSWAPKSLQGTVVKILIPQGLLRIWTFPKYLLKASTSTTQQMTKFQINPKRGRLTRKYRESSKICKHWNWKASIAPGG